MKCADKKILIIEDEDKIVEVLKSYLEHSGYMVFVASDGKSALEKFKNLNPDLIILDLMLPDISGEEICTKIRNFSRVPIIMLTAKVDEGNILNGLDIGADDYITKPFSPKQLVARVMALLRRTENEEIPITNLISYNKGDLVIHLAKREVSKNGKFVNLTPNEYKILVTLMKYPRKTFTREELISIALGEDFDGFDRTIDTHIKNLRNKIETDSKVPIYIITVHGVGYTFNGNNFPK